MAEGFMYVDDESVDRVTQAARGALILAKDGCDSCAAYESDVRRLQEQGLLGEVVVGKILLTQPGCRAFKRENPWLRDVTYLPYTVLYQTVSASTSSVVAGNVPPRARVRRRLLLGTWQGWDMLLVIRIRGR